MLKEMKVSEMMDKNGGRCECGGKDVDEYYFGWNGHCYGYIKTGTRNTCKDSCITFYLNGEPMYCKKWWN